MITKNTFFCFKTETTQMLILSLAAMTGLEKCCITSAYLQWLFHSGERVMAHGPFVSSAPPPPPPPPMGRGTYRLWCRSRWHRCQCLWGGDILFLVMIPLAWVFAWHFLVCTKSCEPVVVGGWGGGTSVFSGNTVTSLGFFLCHWYTNGIL